MFAIRKALLSFFALAISLPQALGQTNTPCGAPALAVNASCTYTAGTTVGATSQTNGANGGTPSCGLMGEDVWYSFVAPASGSVQISFTGGSITDGVAALYSGPCGGLTQMSCSDDAVGLMPQLTSASLTPGATYYIRFWDYGGGAGTFNTCVQSLAPPAGNTTCTVQTPICSGSPIIFTANTGGTPASTVNPGNNYSCLFTSPNPSWYYLEIATGGVLTIDITAGSDVDYAIWGPFASQAAGVAACNSYGAPADCSYSPSPIEQVSIAGVTPGQVYVLLVTNFANTVQNITVTNAGGTATTNCAIVLPVGFSAWDATLTNGEVRMNWTTESETNNDYFAVQRSNDGLVWETIGIVDGAGTSSAAHNYFYTDKKPVLGMNYYRLMQVDNNGQTELSPIRTVHYKTANDRSIHPNPTKAFVFVGENDNNRITAVELVDNVGRVQPMIFTEVDGGVNVDCRGAAHGTYFLRCTDEKGAQTSSLLVIE